MGTSPKRPRVGFRLLFGFTLAFAIGARGFSQDAPVAKQSDDPDLQGSLARSISFSRDREMEIQLRGANTAFASGNSVEGVRILAELLSLPELHNIQVGSTLRDVRVEATRLLRISSEEIREQFRRHTQVRAAEELREAQEKADYEAVSAVASRYPFTPVARESVEILATQFQDHGRFDAVIQAASRWIDRSPDANLAAKQSPQLVALWQQALKEVGMSESAAQLATRFLTPAEKTPAPAQHPATTLPDAVALSPEQVAAWNVRSELSEAALGFLRKVLNDLARQGIHPTLSIRPLMLREHIVWRSLTELVCVQRTTGEVLWRRPIADPIIDNITQMSERRPDGNLMNRLRMQMGHRVLRNSILGQISSDGERIYTIEYTPDATPVPEPVVNEAQNNLPPPTDKMPLPDMCVVARSLADGSIQWRTNEVWGLKEPRAFFFGPPVAQGTSLYSVIQSQEQMLLLRMDPATGALDGASVLGEVQHLSDDRRRMSEACPIVWHDGVAICATGAGGIAAFDVYRGQLQWGFRHTRDDVVISQGLLLPPVDKNGWNWLSGWEEPQLLRFGTSVIYGSPETNRLRCLDAAEGELKWEVPIAGTRAIIGGDDERVVLEGAGIVRSLRLPDGSLEREYKTPARIVSSMWMGSVCRLTLIDGQQIDWSPLTGQTVTSHPGVANQTQLFKAGTLNRIHGEPEQTLSRHLLFGGHPVVTRVNEISLHPASANASADQPARHVPSELAWKAGDTQQWLVALTDWIEKAPADEQKARIEMALTEWAMALDSGETQELPLKEWASRWSLSPDQVREISYRCLQRAMQNGENLVSLRHLLRLLELQPADWETEMSRARWGKVDAEVSVTRTVRLDASLRGAIQELWERANADQRAELQAAYQEWSGRESTKLDELTRPLEQLSFLPAPAKERPLEWKTLGELARQQLSLRHLSTHEDRTTAAAALWRLVELHMARGEWENAAGLIEQLKRRFGSVAVRGNQTAEELVRQFPKSSLVFKSLDRDRRTTWPDREPVVTAIDTGRSPDSQQPIPVRAERGSIFDRLNLSYAPRQLQFAGLGKVNRSWTLSVPGDGKRNLGLMYPEIKSGWAFGQFVVVQIGSEVCCVSSLNAKGEPKTPKAIWPLDKKSEPKASIDTLGNEDNDLSNENRPVRQVVGFVRRDSEPFDGYGHRATWVGPVSAGTLCFLQQGMLVCVETATGQELWRRYDVPAGVRTFGDDGVVAMLRDGNKTVELLNPLDGRTLQVYESEHLAEEWIRNWGRIALAATGQPSAETVLNPATLPTPPASAATATPPAASDVAAPKVQELQLKMVDLAGPKTLWERAFPPGSAVFEVDEDWLGVISMDGTLSFLDVQTGQTVRQSTVTIPPGLTQIATAVTERSIFVTLSPPVTESALVGSKPTKLKPRQFYVNGPVHAFDRSSGEYQWSQQIENRVFPIDQVRDVPLLICADVWKGPLDPMPEVGEVFPKLDDKSQPADEPNALRVRYWALDSRTGRVVLNTAVDKSTIQYTVERNLAEGWVEIRLGLTIYRFSYADTDAEKSEK